ncbi:hypothetical protein [Rhizobacter sp. LjRoot28]|uniref:hypothetical protein n=1 Tax=Rhizobacter sp. LjRoot28 TaxID=3342309 RepID=UPI003ECF225B
MSRLAQDETARLPGVPLSAAPAGTGPGASSSSPASDGRSASRVTLLARTLSVVGHPALLMPAAVAGGAWFHQAPVRALAVGAAATLAVSACVMGFSAWRVRTGRWQHPDASVPVERHELNRFLLLLLLGGAVALAAAGEDGVMAAGLGLSGAIVAFAQLLRRWMKVSLHAAFAVFSAALLWPGPPAFALVLLLALGVGWSRWWLRRHRAVEVLTGWATGAVAGLAVNLLAAGATGLA